jgi:TRAP-type C4-dicarboxylate transport system substrate-binding protein
MKRMLLFCMATMVAVSLIIGGCTTPEAPAPSTPTPTPSTPTPSTPAPTKTITLKATFYQPANHTAVIHFKEVFADVETMTEGRVKVDVYDSQTLVKVPETFDALNRGIADLTDVPLPPLRLNVPWWSVELLPGLLKDYKGMHDAAENGMLDMYQQAIHDAGLKIKVLHLFCPGVTYIMTKEKRIAVPEDMKGLKIACFDAPSAKLIDTLGGVGQVIPSPETYEALLRGMVDGATSNTSGLSQYNWQEPCDYLCLQSFGGPYVATLVAEDALAQLSESDQAIITMLAEKYGLVEELGFAIGEKRMLETLIKPQLKEIVTPTPEQSKLWEAAVAPHLDEWLAQAGEDGQKAVDILRENNP